MAKAIKAEQYVLLPAGGLRAKARGAGAEAQAFLRSTETSGAENVTLEGRQVPMRVIDSISPD
ncbi:MAG TPA: hypothetical protein VGP53_01765, partial [Acidimicrobiales bacterium]|nr:hypothetical protein [Acidimicrobiales bacterium]